MASPNTNTMQTNDAIQEPDHDATTLDIAELALIGPPHSYTRQYRIPISTSSKQLYDVINSPIAIEIHLDVSGSGWVNWFYGKKSNGDYYQGYESLEGKRTVYELTEPLDPIKLCSN